MRLTEYASLRSLLTATALLLATFGHGAMADGALKVSREATLNAPPSIVWKMIGGFNDLDMWHPAVASSELTGSGTTPGDVRVLSLNGGGTIKERLVAYSPGDMSYTYAIEESPLPVANYVSTLKVTPAADGKSLVTWSSSFDAKDAPNEKAEETIGGIYDAGLGRLTGYFNAK